MLPVLQTGGAWEDLPRAYGAPTTAWRRLQAWSQEGTWERLGRALLGQLAAHGKLEWSEAFRAGRFVPAKEGVGRWVTPTSAKVRR
jgi:transposase